MMNGLLFSLPGTPVIYYGDEIGMGDNIYLGDRNAVRTPMQWNADRNAGFSTANPQRLYLPVVIDPEYHSQAVNVEAQQENPNSLLVVDAATHRSAQPLPGVRPRHARDPPPRQPQGPGLPAPLRRREHPRRRQPVAVRPARRARPRRAPRSPCPSSCSAAPSSRRSATCRYFITLGPHGFYWFSLRAPAPRRPRRSARGAGPPAPRRRRATGVSCSPPTGGAAPASPRRGSRSSPATAGTPGARRPCERPRSSTSVPFAVGRAGLPPSSRSCRWSTATASPRPMSCPVTRAVGADGDAVPADHGHAAIAWVDVAAREEPVAALRRAPSMTRSWTR